MAATADTRELVPSTSLAGAWPNASSNQPLLAEDAIDIAFTIGHNDHPDFGGLELTLRDFRTLPADSTDAATQLKKQVPVAQ